MLMMMDDDRNSSDVTKLESILRRRGDFPARQRKKIIRLATTFVDCLLEEYFGDAIDDEDLISEDPVSTLESILRRKEIFPEQEWRHILRHVTNFLVELGQDIHTMATKALNCQRDTLAEVETALRFYPETLSRRSLRCGGLYPDYPIRCLARQCNTKAIPFIHLFARLAIEFGSFQEHERGGLLARDTHDRDNVLEKLVESSHAVKGEEQRHVDTTSVTELIRLRELGLMEKQDIQRYELVRKLCIHGSGCFEQRGRFLIEWDPYSILLVDSFGNLPLRYAAEFASLAGFRFVFELGMRYFPQHVGINLLFRSHDRNNSSDHRTPIKQACARFKRKDVMRVIDDVLAHSSLTTPLNITDAFLVAILDDTIHLDAVYFLFRRQPDTLIRLITNSSSSSSGSSIRCVGGCRDNDDDDDDDDTNNKNNGVISKSKRKRE